MVTTAPTAPARAAGGNPQGTVMSDRAKYQQAATHQQFERDIASGRLKPVPKRITQALDLHELYGPDVDRELGGEEPMVDEWEEGKRVPTLEQIKLLAKLTGYPVRFFYTPMPELTGTMFICRGSGRKKGCEVVQLGPAKTSPQPPTPPQPPAGATVIPLRHGGTPGFRCLIPKCPLRGRRQPAPTNEAADAAWRQHFLDFHHTPPTAAKTPDRRTS
ncbi:hypothetical protein ABZ897_16205 [Nonomuraea sp. NPDC046802]|uniref:hypothetical protein n=1 Tax=Nonomuraea sp. NPDC046802 TaxID=3154919 RepID=UPI0033E5D0D9